MTSPPSSSEVMPTCSLPRTSSTAFCLEVAPPVHQRPAAIPVRFSTLLPLTVYMSGSSTLRPRCPVPTGVHASDILGDSVCACQTTIVGQSFSSFVIREVLFVQEALWRPSMGEPLVSAFMPHAVESFRVVKHLQYCCGVAEGSLLGVRLPCADAVSEL